MFEKGELIVYGRTGICEVKDVTTLKMDGVEKERLFYILVPLKDRSGKIFTPVDNSKVPMRHILSRDEASALISEIPEIPELWIASDKLREASYKECMGTCRCEEWIRIIKTLYLRKQKRLAEGKKITATDERYLKQAEQHLYAELSLALGIPEDKMENYIAEHVGSTRS